MGAGQPGCQSVISTVSTWDNGVYSSTRHGQGLHASTVHWGPSPHVWEVRLMQIPRPFVHSCRKGQ